MLNAHTYHNDTRYFCVIYTCCVLWWPCVHSECTCFIYNYCTYHSIHMDLFLFTNAVLLNYYRIW